MCVSASSFARLDKEEVLCFIEAQLTAGFKEVRRCGICRIAEFFEQFSVCSDVFINGEIGDVVIVICSTCMLRNNMMAVVSLFRWFHAVSSTACIYVYLDINIQVAPLRIS